MRKQVILIVLLGLFLISGLFAAGEKEEQAAKAEGPQSIIYYLWDDPTYKDIVDTYNQSSTDVRVDSKFVPAGDYEAKLTTLLAGGAEMDAYMQKRQVDMFSQYANGYIANLEELIAKHGYDINAVGAYKDALSIDGKIVAVPFRGAGYYIYYNEKLFEEAGEPTPDTYVDEGTWTWDKYVEVARRMSSGDDEQYGGLWYTWGICQAPLAFQEGVEFITADGEIDVSDKVWESFKLRKMLEEEKIIPKLVDLKVTKTHYSQAFYSGNIAMLIIGEWFPGYMIKAKRENLLKGYSWEDWAITRLPSDQGVYHNFGNPTFNHIHSNSHKKDAAFKFLGWMGGPEGAKVVAEAGFLPPMVTSGVKQALEVSVPDRQSLNYLTESAPVMPVFYNKYGSRIDQYLGKFMETYLTTDMSDSEMKEKFLAGLEEIQATTD